MEYLHLDADPKPDESPDAFKQRMLPQIKQHKEPSVEIDSGNGLQLLWKLGPAIEISKNREEIKDIEARKLGPDRRLWRQGRHPEC